MPISAERMKLYPGGSIRSAEWNEIRERIRRRADSKCEECGVPNHALGGRENGRFFAALPTGDNGLRLTWPRPGEYATCEGGRYLRIIRIVCTVAHLNHDETDNRDENLRFWCQRCHNRHDAKHRQENATITRHRKQGQADLFGRAPSGDAFGPVRAGAADGEADRPATVRAVER